MNWEKCQLQSFKKSVITAFRRTSELLQLLTDFEGIITKGFQLSFKPLTPQSLLYKNLTTSDPNLLGTFRETSFFLGYFFILRVPARRGEVSGL